jgi:cytochrome c556
MTINVTKKEFDYMTKMKWMSVAALAVFAPMLVAASIPDIITARQANFKQMGRAFKGMNDEVKLAAPSVPALQANAIILEKSAARVALGFPKGSGASSGVKTSALPAVWEKWAEYKTDANALRLAARNLRIATASGNVDTIKAAMPAVGMACKTCHQTFKAKD